MRSELSSWILIFTPSCSCSPEMCDPLGPMNPGTRLAGMSRVAENGMATWTVVPEGVRASRRSPVAGLMRSPFRSGSFRVKLCFRFQTAARVLPKTFAISFEHCPLLTSAMRRSSSSWVQRTLVFFCVAISVNFKLFNRSKYTKSPWDKKIFPGQTQKTYEQSYEHPFPEAPRG